MHLSPIRNYNNDIKCLVSVKLNFILANLNGILTCHTDKDEDDDLEGNLRFRAFFRSVFVTKKLRFFGFGDYCVFCSVSLSVFGKNKIGFSDLLFDAVWCFLRFFVGKVAPQWTSTAYSFCLILLAICTFDRNVFRFFISNCTVLRFLIRFKPPHL